MLPERSTLTVPGFLAEHAQNRPDEIACYHRQANQGWLPTTWFELAARVSAASAAFAELKLAAQDRIAILAPTSRDWWIAELAALDAAAVVVGIDAHATHEQAQFVLRHCRARALLVDTLERLRLFPQELVEGLKFVIVLSDQQGASRTANQHGWKSLCEPHLSAARKLRCVPRPEDQATLIYTSGTTGTPKAIAFSHAQILHGCQAILDAFPEIEPGDTTLCWLPMAHLFQRMMNQVAMARGATTYFVEDPRGILDALREVEPAVLIAVPRFYEKLHEGIQTQLARQPSWRRRLFERALDAGRQAAEARRSGRKLSWGRRWQASLLDRLVLSKVRRLLGKRLKFAITGSAPMPTWLLDFYDALGLLVLEAYGLSENTVPLCANTPTARRRGSVGRPLASNELRLSPEGEVQVRGFGMFTGYEASDEPDGYFTEDGFYRTGDCAQFDEDGFLYLVGRISEIIKTSTGRRISPARIEQAYKQSPLLDEVVVVGHGQRHLAALVVVNRIAVERALAPAFMLGLSAQEFAVHPYVRNIVLGELHRHAEGLASHERISSFAILPEPFTIEGGELTPLLKLRRRRIEAKHAQLIRELFSQPQSLADQPVTGSAADDRRAEVHAP